MGKNKLSIKLDDGKKFEKNNAVIALNILYTKGGKILSCYISTHISNCEETKFY